jgi:hypothetical protein
MPPFRHAASALSVSAAAVLASSCGTGLSRTWASRSRFRAHPGRRPGAPRRRAALRLPCLRPTDAASADCHRLHTAPPTWPGRPARSCRRVWRRQRRGQQSLLPLSLRVESGCAATHFFAYYGKSCESVNINFISTPTERFPAHAFTDRGNVGAALAQLRQAAKFVRAKDDGGPASGRNGRGGRSLT